MKFFTALTSFTCVAVLAALMALSVAVALPPGCALAADPEVPGELLLTVAPCPDGADVEGYLDDIASSAGAYVVRVYTALSMTEDDPILLLIRSDTKDNAYMLEVLKKDKRVYSATPNRIYRIRPVKEPKIIKN